MKYWKEKIICLFIGHWTNIVGLYIYDEETGMTYNVPGCLRCRKVLNGS